MKVEPVRGSPVVIATRNRGKLVELRALLEPLGFAVRDLSAVPESPDEDAVESAETFEGNALAKARYYHARLGGAAVIADDSGLVVRALGGAPGVRSRRYSGASGSDAEVSAANTRKLLTELAGVSDQSAEFVCAIAFVDASREFVATGRTSGRILSAPVGQGGFGYDPVFWSADLGCSFGEASAEAKARVSHRARALRALVDVLRDRGSC